MGTERIRPGTGDGHGLHGAARTARDAWRAARRATAAHAVALAVSALALAACSVAGPEYERPHTGPPSGWSPTAAAAMASAPTSRPVAAPFDAAAWWSVFNDAELDRLVAEAVAQNLDVQAAALRIGEARAQRRLTAAGEYPSVGLTAAGGRSRQSENDIAGALGSVQSAQAAQGGAGGAGGQGAGAPGLASNLFQIGFDATWELDLWGKTRRNVEAADAEIGAAQAARQEASVSVTAEIVRSYVGLRGAQQQLAIIDADIAAQRRIAALTDSRARAGFSPQSDASMQSGQLASAESQRPQLQVMAAQSVNRIALLLAQPPGALAERLAAPQGSAQALALPPEVPVGLPGELLERRPDVQRSEADLRAAVARIGVARAGLFPTIRLGLFGGLQAMRAADLRDWASRFLAGGSAITLPIFKGGEVKAQIRLADLRSQEAALNYRRTVLSAFHDADNALLAYADDQQRTESLQRQLDLAVRNRVLAEHRHDAGLSPLTEVLSTQRSEHAAALSLAQSATAARTDLVALYKALGGGWRAEDGQPAN